MSDNRTDIPSTNAPNFEQRVRETLMTYLGKVGNPLDRGLTLRDLIETGVLKIRSGFTLKPGSGSTVPLEPGDGVVDVYEPDLTPPPTPTGFAVSAAISHVFIEHDAPLYTQGHGHLRTRVYGAIVQTGDPLPVFTDAVEITQFTGTVHAHPSNPATTWRLWIKWETNDGVLSVSPAGGTNGLEVTTGQDVALLLEALTGQITQSQLYQDLGTRIDLIDGPISLAGSVAARIYAEEQERLAADTTLGSSITTLQNSDATQATQITSLQTRASDAESNIINLQNTTASQATTIQSLTTRTTSAESKIVNLQTTTANQATQLSTLSTSVGNNTAAIQTEATTRASETGELFAKYTVKVDVAGHVSGYGLASTSNGATPTSQLGVRANQFFVAPPSVSQATAPTTELYKGYVWVDTSVTPNITKYYTGSAWSTTPQALPFIIQTSPTTINGVSVPAGVYMDTAYIRDGTITNAKIGNAAIDDAKIVNLSASKITAGSIGVGDYIQSTGYIAGSAGWRINGNGNAEFSNAVVRGTVYATNGEFTGTVYAVNGEFTGTVKAGTTILGGAATTYRAGSGFYGGLDSTTYKWRVGTPTGARIQWTGSSIEVYNASNQLTMTSGGINASFVSGLGAFATLEKITSANIGTYIGSTAIGSAYIGLSEVKTANIDTGAINTLKVAGNAITASSASSISFGYSTGTVRFTNRVSYTAPSDTSITLLVLVSGRVGTINGALANEYLTQLYLTTADDYTTGSTLFISFGGVLFYNAFVSGSALVTIPAGETRYFHLKMDNYSGNNANFTATLNFFAAKR